MTNRDNPQTPLPLGKLPPDLLKQLFERLPSTSSRLLIGPGVGMDCAVLDFGFTLLVLKSDPITFTTDATGWYLVQVNANDIATTGATARWMLVTALLPEGKTTPESVESLTNQVFEACGELGISVIGGHTEITAGLDRPILIGTLIGEVDRERLVTPRGIRPGDRLLLTKGVPVEATAIVAREFPELLRGKLSEAEIKEAQNYLYEPGIGVSRDAQVALRAGRVSAMHDPTEGGLMSALWEMAEAGGVKLRIAIENVPVPELSRRVCAAAGIDPLKSIASGALLMAVHPASVKAVERAMGKAGILCAQIGTVEAGAVEVWAGEALLSRPERDEIARLFEERA